MPKSNNQKIKLLLIYEILRQYSDEEHSLSTKEIIEKLSKNGVDVASKVLFADIALLNKYGF